MGLLHDLYAELDAITEQFMEIPREDVRAYWANGQPEDSDVGRNFAARKAVNERMDASGLYRDFEADLTELFAERVKADPANFAGALYGSLCNVDWQHDEGSRYSCSWRYAGGVVSELAGGDDYMDYYCSGGEGHIDSRVADALEAIGWRGSSL
jgi:hypothetical protein